MCVLTANLLHSTAATTATLICSLHSLNTLGSAFYTIWLWFLALHHALTIVYNKKHLLGWFSFRCDPWFSVGCIRAITRMSGMHKELGWQMRESLIWVVYYLKRMYCFFKNGCIFLCKNKCFVIVSMIWMQFVFI